TPSQLDDALARIVQRECEQEGRDDGQEGLTARVRRARVQVVEDHSHSPLLQALFEPIRVLLDYLLSLSHCL
ncbi:hypothetical protein PFISCL1PPCAC_25672, partial [Pristionchus fissidentatus]